MIVDSHCHLDYFDPSAVEGVVNHAKSLGVNYLQTICTKFSEFETKILPISEKYNNVFCSIGVHPLDCEGKEEIITDEDLLKFTNHPKVIGIGETGLDYYREGHPPKDRQKENFLAHIEASKQSKLPIIIHNRSSDEDMIKILKENYSKSDNNRGLIHCFSSSRELAICAMEIGFYISFSGIITFNSGKNICDIISEGIIPENKMLVETDAPFLTPSPFRHEKQNKPGYTLYVVKKLAKLLGQSEEYVAKLTTHNFQSLFSKSIIL